MIARVYLQWVGTSSFATVADFVSDVRVHGVRKKLPNRYVAAEVAKPDTVIFLAHDQGRLRECLRCAELVTCPTCGGNSIVDGQTCRRCKGLGSLERGTGGSALVDGETWTYVRLLQLKKNRGHPFWSSSHEIKSVTFCPSCGGRGKLPQGIVFGLYLPHRVIRDGSGGFFAIALQTVSTDADDRAALLALVGPIEFVGRFGLLATPIPYEGKQFRGVKRWEPPPLVPQKEERSLLEGAV